MLAGTNGAGKSSVGGVMLRSAGDDYFNPDEVARRFRANDPLMSQATANAGAWRQGVEGIRKAIADRGTFVFETTLGGASVSRYLRQAAEAGMSVEIWYVALASPELHLERIRQRVARGGHDIPEDAVRRRYDTSRLNLISLLPVITELRLSDNSVSAEVPSPTLLLHYREPSIRFQIAPERTPDWAKPIIAAALRVARKR